MRFIKNCMVKDELKERYLTTKEVIDAETIWTKMVQREIKESQNYPQLVKQLNNVKIDGIVKCKGRLQFSELSFESQIPALLPKEHGYTDLVVKEAYYVVLHGLVNTTLAKVRQRYWILKGRKVCKRIIKQCKDCAKRRSKAIKGTVTAPLPEVRVKPARPFAVTGCDFTGPIYLQNNEKSYVALFTCAVKRAAHLELTRDMTVLEFRVILQRFASRQSAPSTVISDNAKTFKSTGKHLEKICNNEELHGYLTTRRIEWTFNVAKAPWQGGFFERLIGISKSILYKVLGRSKLSFREVETLLIQVEGLMNNRPLTYQTDELEDEPLTPNHHMIFGYALPNIASDITKEVDDDEGSC